MGFRRQFVRPVVYFILAALIVAAVVLFIGMTLINLHPEEIGDTIAQEFIRPDLLVAFLLSLAVLFVGALLARTPRNERAIDEPVAVGGTPFWSHPSAQVDLAAQARGPQGTLADIKPGDTLYAQSGQLGKIVSILPGEVEYGRKRRGFLYATGVYGANEAMWIPVEAVMAVFPETNSVLLAAKGDEIEHFGWNRPPESFRRDSPPFEAPKSF